MFIEYSQPEFVNEYSPEKSAMKLCTFFARDVKNVYPLVERFLRNFKGMKPIEAKKVKEQCDLWWKRYIVGQDTGNKIIEQIKCLEPKDVFRDNLIHSLTRIPEWFLYTEDYLNKTYAPTMKNRLDDINALATDESIYPYSKSIGICYDICKDLERQDKYVQQFAEKHDISEAVRKRINYNSIVQALLQIKKWVMISDIDAVPGWAHSWVLMAKEMRANSGELKAVYDRIEREGFSSVDLTLSESVSPLNWDAKAQYIVQKLGWKDKNGKSKISALLSNIFHLYYGKDLQIPSTSGQLLHLYSDKDNYLFAIAGPGLGPCFKIRIVYCTSSEIQNYCNVAANFLDKYHGMTYSHAYRDQTSYILENAKYMKDVQCTDCTGYSDYLNRNIYQFIMELFGFPRSIIDKLMKILAMPVKVNDEIHPVPFGSLQGVKFLVFIMNDANAVIGLIQNILRKNKWTDRQEAGDDVWSGSREYYFEQEDLETDMITWMYFNCPTNMSKTAWLKRDKYWDFCKVFFGENGKPITGIPPKLFMKQIINIHDISDYYINFDRTGVIPYRSIESFWSKLKDLFYDDLKDGMMLNNLIHKNSLDDKIEIAQDISYRLGGLSSREPDPKERLNHLMSLCEKLYTSYELKPGNIYEFAKSAGFDEEIGKFLLQIRQTRAREFVCLLSVLNMIAEEYNTYGSVNLDMVRQVEKDLDMMTRVFLDTGKVGASGSTYHRITPRYSTDTTLFRPKDFISNGVELIYKLPTCFFDTVLFGALFDEKELIADIDRLNMYVSMSKLYDNLKGQVEWGGGGNRMNFGSNPYFRSKDGYRYRMYFVENDTYYKDIRPYSDLSDPDEREFVRIFKTYNLGNTLSSVQQHLYNATVSQARKLTDIVKKDYRKYLKYYSNYFLKFVDKDVENKMEKDGEWTTDSSGSIFSSAFYQSLIDDTLSQII